MLGKTLGHYEVLEPLGQGGMGEVYRARDTRLGRDVAIKVLRSSLAGSAEVNSRFQREARTISALNHPHICVLHDVGREGDTSFLVMELVEGETLAHRIGRGALEPGAVLRYGAQIADALDRAHRAGVVHRDLKPGNVMITRAGAKLMDFGLARITAPESSHADPTATALPHSPTVAHPLTAEGSLLGTFQYMAPEQLEGREADSRADLWALGCVLYEMATGERAFDGRTQASLIGAIMHTEPRSVTELAPLTPLDFERLVRACLRKDPDERVQSAHDVKLQLEWMAEGVSSTSGVRAPSMPGKSKRPAWIVPAMAAIVTALVSVMVTALVLGSRSTESPSSPLMHFTVGQMDLRPQSAPMLAPDGTYLVLSGFDGAEWKLFRRSLSGHAVEPIPGTEGGSAPFLSPDGAWIGFVTSDAVKKIPARGGLAQQIAAVPRINAGEWGPDDMIYLSQHAGGDGTTALFRVPATGGRIEVVARLDPEKGENVTWLPELLPDGKTVLLTVLGASGRGIDAVRPDGTRERVLDNAFLARYVDSGHLLYLDQMSEAVLAVRFDPATLRTEGAAIPLTDRVDGNFCFDVRSDGPLVYVPAAGSADGLRLVWIDRTGAVSLVSELMGSWAQPRLSPDGTRIVFRKSGALCDLMMLDLQTGSFGRLVQRNDNHDPLWSPDGTRLMFLRDDAGETILLDLDGPRTTTVLARGSQHGTPSSWSPVDDLVVFTQTGTGTGSDLWIGAPQPDAERTVYLATPHNESQAAFSPDGRWIAYVSDQMGTNDVYLRAFPDTGAEWRISAEGGNSPVWSHDGTELFFAAGRKMMAAAVSTTPQLRTSSPVELFEGGFSTAHARDFDVAADGRFLSVGSPSGVTRLDEVRIVLNWQQELAQASARR